MKAMGTSKSIFFMAFPAVTVMSWHRCKMSKGTGKREGGHAVERRDMVWDLCGTPVGKQGVWHRMRVVWHSVVWHRMQVVWEQIGKR